MERIKGKFDDTENKIRPGATWVSGFTLPGNNDDIRSVDSDGAEMRFIPASRYYASCEIKRGQAVSIAQLNDLTDKQKTNKYAYVKITDPDIDDSCLGIAMNYAREGQIVQIQSKGKFNYYTTDSVLNTAERRKTEIFLNADGWNYDEVRGQKLYIKKLYNDTTESGRIVNSKETYDSANQSLLDEAGDSFDTDHADTSREADVDNVFTYDFYDSIYNVRNTIQIGYLTDAPTTNRLEGALTRKNSNGKISFVDSNGSALLRAVVVDRDKNDKLVIVEGSTDTNPLIGENGDDWWKKLKEESRLPKAHEATWLQKIQIVVNGVKTDYYSPVDDCLVTIELDVTGDTRGPIDNTQFILTLGENIYFNTYKHDIDYSKLDENDNLIYAPNFNEGIYDEIKVLAIAQGNPTGPFFRFFTKASTHVEDTELDQGFIGIRKLDGDTYIIPVLTKKSVDTFKNDVMESLIDPNDEGYYKLSKAFTTSTKNDYTLPDGTVQHRSPEIIFTEPLKVFDRDTLKVAIDKVLKEIFVDEDSFRIGCTTNLTDIGDNGFTITTEETGGYYDVYVSQDVLGYLSCTVVNHGQTAKAGEAILADIRDKERLNVVGVVLSNQTGIRRKGETVKVMKSGRLVTLGNMQPGTEYFLGLNGRITAKAQYWYDHNVPVGTAESANYMLVDVSQFPMHSYSGNFPLGYIKPSIAGQPEKGFVLADGHTVYSIQEYPELYQLLLNWYDEEELLPSNVTEEVFDKSVAANLQGIFSQIYDDMDKMKLQNAVVQASLAKEASEIVAHVSQYSSRIDSLEKTDSKHNSKIATLEERLDDVEKLDSEQQERLAAIEALDTEQQSRLQTVEKDNASQAKSISDIESKNKAQDKALEDFKTEQKEKDEAQDTATNAAIDAYKTEQESVDKAQNEALAELSERVATKVDLAKEIDKLNQAITDAIQTANETAASKDTEQTESIRNAVTNEITEAIAEFVTNATLEAYKTAQAEKDAEQERRIDTVDSKNTEQEEHLAEIDKKNSEQDTAIEAAEETEAIDAVIESLNRSIQEQQNINSIKDSEIAELTDKLNNSLVETSILKSLLITVLPPVEITATTDEGIAVENNSFVFTGTGINLSINDEIADASYWTGACSPLDARNAVYSLGEGLATYSNAFTGKTASFSATPIDFKEEPVLGEPESNEMLMSTGLVVHIPVESLGTIDEGYSDISYLVTASNGTVEFNEDRTVISFEPTQLGEAKITLTTEATDSIGKKLSRSAETIIRILQAVTAQITGLTETTDFTVLTGSLGEANKEVSISFKEDIYYTESADEPDTVTRTLVADTEELDEDDFNLTYTNRILSSKDFSQSCNLKLYKRTSVVGNTHTYTKVGDLKFTFSA